MPLKSMTGYGISESQFEDCSYRCEMKTVNSRFIDVNVRLPKTLASLENKIIRLVKKRLNRGKVDIYIDFNTIASSDSLPVVDSKALTHYISQVNLAKKSLVDAGVDFDFDKLDFYSLTKLEGVLQTKNTQSSQDVVSQHEGRLMGCIEKSLSQVVASRETEGAELRKALDSFLQNIAKTRSFIEQNIEKLQSDLYENYKRKLNKFLKKLADTGHSVATSFTEERLLTEVGILADRSDIQEELTRLAAHENEFHNILEVGDNIGRKLDFLCQEMHREINTISSKIMDIEISKHTLSIKQMIEHLRQQIQNIE